MDKEFKSIFAPGTKISANSYMAEMLIKNFIEWKNKKNKRQSSLPSFAFWKKDSLAKHPEYKDLAKQYALEIVNINWLLYSFSPKVIISYIKERKLIYICYLDDSKKQRMIFNLWKSEISYRKEMKKLSKKVKKSMNSKNKDVVTDVQKRKTQTTLMSEL